MIVKKLMTKRFCLSLGAALSVASVLVTHRGGPAPNLEGEGIMYVYYTSLCATPGDSRDCREVPQTVRPRFESMAACTAHADAALSREHDPRMMTSCLKQREG